MKILYSALLTFGLLALSSFAADKDEQLVYKRPNPDACQHCKRVYLTDGITPRVFKLSDLTDSNDIRSISSLIKNLFI